MKASCQASGVELGACICVPGAAHLTAEQPNWWSCVPGAAHLTAEQPNWWSCVPGAAHLTAESSPSGGHVYLVLPISRLRAAQLVVMCTWCCPSHGWERPNWWSCVPGAAHLTAESGPTGGHVYLVLPISRLRAAQLVVITLLPLRVRPQHCYHKWESKNKATIY